MRSALLTPSLYHLLLQSHKHRDMVEGRRRRPVAQRAVDAWRMW